MNKKIISMLVVGVVLVGSVSFYAGVKYVGGNNSPRTGNLTNIGQDGQMRFSQNSGMGMRGGKGFGGVTIGEILAKDETSITVKLPDGGSKLVFFTDKTVVTKNAVGSIADLVVNENVIVNGSVNSDGSVSAQNIELGSRMEITLPFQTSAIQNSQ